MDSLVKLLLRRSANELLAAETLLKISNDALIKQSLCIPAESAFYSPVISHSYYSIFYSAKAILTSRGIKTVPPEIHKKTFLEFQKNLVETGVLDMKLLEIYNMIVVTADHLLEIFKDERWKRGKFTYEMISQAKNVSADESVRNARIFYSNIGKVLESR